MRLSLPPDLSRIDWGALDPDSLEIARLKVAGFTSKEIAAQLGLEDRTVRRRLNALEAAIRRQAEGLPPAPAEPKAVVTLSSKRRVGVTTVPETHISYVQYGALPLSPTMEQLARYQDRAEAADLSLHAWALQVLDRAAA